jgi:hypothetical protein
LAAAKSGTLRNSIQVSPKEKTMAQIDSIQLFSVPGGPATATVEIHVPAGQGSVSNNPSDFPYVDPNHGGTTVSGAPVVATKLTVAGVRFANPS